MVFVTSDLHGYPVERFEQLLAAASFGSGDVCYVLGDVIDRGAHGAALLQWLLRQPNVRLIQGNHEAMMLDARFALEDDRTEYTESQLTALRRWLSNGGNPTLDGLSCLSYRHAVALMEQVERLPLYAEAEAGGQRFWLTHSGLGNFHPDKPLSAYTERELLWHRPLPDEVYHRDVITVFGHTPTLYLNPDFCGRVLRTPTWIDVDTGAALGLEPTLLCLDTMEEYRLCD